MYIVHNNVCIINTFIGDLNFSLSLGLPAVTVIPVYSKNIMLYLRLTVENIPVYRGRNPYTGIIKYSYTVGNPTSPPSHGAWFY